MESVVCDYIAIKGGGAELTLSTSNPTELLNYLETHPCQNALYILDVDLQHEINGIVLATKIRKHDTFGKIIFVTSYAELSHLTFRYKVEAMDYILKDNKEEIIERIKECMDIAQARYKDSALKKDHYKLKTGDGIRNIPIDEIMFFESHHMSHKLILHTKSTRIEFYGSLNEVSGVSPDFFRCHKSFVVNTKNIRFINKTTREIEMINGAIALITPKKIKDLLEAMPK